MTAAQDAARRARLDDLSRRARALHCDPGPADSEMAELREKMTALEQSLAAAFRIARTETPPQRPALRLISGGAG